MNLEAAERERGTCGKGDRDTTVSQFLPSMQ
jgi:hypothetical protein